MLRHRAVGLEFLHLRPGERKEHVSLWAEGVTRCLSNSHLGDDASSEPKVEGARVLRVPACLVEAVPQAQSLAFSRLLTLLLGVLSTHMLRPLGAIGTTPRRIKQVRLSCDGEELSYCVRCLARPFAWKDTA